MPVSVYQLENICFALDEQETRARFIIFGLIGLSTAIVKVKRRVELRIRAKNDFL